MRKLTFAALAVLGGCSSPAPAPSTDQEMAVVMALSIQDPQALKAGQWVYYTIREEGKPTATATKLSVVSSVADKFWIEQKTPYGNGFIILKTLLDRTGHVHEIWAGESGSDKPQRVFPGLDAMGKPIQAPIHTGPDPKLELQIADDRLTLDKHVYNCKRMTSSARYSNGTTTKLTTWCSPEVPFGVVHQGTSYGGVVKRTYGRFTLELMGTGEMGAIEELRLPEVTRPR